MLGELLQDPEYKALILKLGGAAVLLLGAATTFFTVKAARLRKMKVPLRRESDAQMRRLEDRLGRVEIDVHDLKQMKEREVQDDLALRRHIDDLQNQMQQQLGLFGGAVGKLSGLVVGLTNRVEDSLRLATEAMKLLHRERD